ncbi:MAG TPA: hypothetical protein VJG83_05100 [archaeon]|nr:hypothetical protein [archaeon]
MPRNLGIKNDLVNWFVKNVAIPNLMRLDIPGFVIVKQNYEGREIEQRNIFFSELQIAGFESALVKNFGERGKKIAYTMLTNSTYAYCHSYGIPQLKDGEKAIDEFFSFYTAFMGVTWGEFLNLDYDLKTKILQVNLGDHIVCRKNGLGYMFSSGIFAGGWQHLMQDPTIQASQIECVGKGDKSCRVIAGPIEYLKKQKYEVIEATGTRTYSTDISYWEMNKSRPMQYSKASLRELIAAGFFKFEKNKLTFHEDRYCFTGIELLYVFEETAAKDPKVSKLLFETTFEQGKKIALAEKTNEYSTFIPDILSAFGYGDTLISHNNSKFIIETNYFPYLETYDQINYQYFKGLVSGLLSGFLGKEIILKNHSTNVSNGYLQLVLLE